MDTQLLDAIRTIIRDEVRKVVREEIQIALKPINARLEKLEKRFDALDLRFDALELEVINLKADMNEGFRRIDNKLKKQDDKIDAMLIAWTIQKQHRRQLDNHEVRIVNVEGRIPAIS